MMACIHNSDAEREVRIAKRAPDGYHVLDVAIDRTRHTIFFSFMFGKQERSFSFDCLLYSHSVCAWAIDSSGLL